jgi:hypothetical protein
MASMTTVTEVLSNLEKEGYTIDFNLMDNSLECHGNYLRLHPDEFRIDRHYRFEGISDPEDEAVVYAISSLKNNLKGVLVNGYGISSDPLTEAMVRALKQKHL